MDAWTAAQGALGLDTGNLVNRTHPLANDLVSWWLVLPTGMGGTRWVNLIAPQHGTLTSMSAARSETSGWGLTRRQGGFGELRFDGTNDLVVVADHPLFTFLTGAVDSPMTLTCAAWMNTIARAACLLSRFNGTTREWVVFTDTGSLLTFQIYHGGGSTIYIAADTTLTTAAHQNQWVSLAFTYDGSGVNTGLMIYINGQRVDTGHYGAGVYVAKADTATALNFGSHTAGNFHLGKMDDIRMYTRALSPGEIAALYVNQMQGYPDLLNRLPRVWGVRAATPAARANFATTFANTTSVTILGSLHAMGHRFLLVTAYDNAAPQQVLSSAAIGIDATSFGVLLSSPTSITGTLVINGFAGDALSAPNLGFSFTASTFQILGTSHGAQTRALLTGVYTSDAVGLRILPASLTIDPVSFGITVTLSTISAGTLVINAFTR